MPADPNGSPMQVVEGRRKRKSRMTFSPDEEDERSKVSRAVFDTKSVSSMSAFGLAGQSTTAISTPDKSLKIDYSEINKDKNYVPKVGDVISTQFPGYGEMWFRAVVEKVIEKPTGTMLDIYYPQDHSYATNVHVQKVRLDGFEGIDHMAIEKHIKKLDDNSEKVKTRTEINKMKKIFGVDKPGSAVGDERERAQRQQQLKEDNAPKKKPRKKKKSSYYKPTPEKEKERAKTGANRAEKRQWTQEELQKNAQVKIEKNDSEVIRKLKLQPIRGITKSTNIQQKKGEKEFLLELFEFSRKNTYYCNEADENAVEVDTPRRSRP